MSTKRRLITALVIVATLVVGCGKKQPSATPITPEQQQQQQTGVSPIEKEMKAPLTEVPSKPARLTWPAAPSISEADLNNTVVKAQQLVNSRKADEAYKELKPLAGAKNRELQLLLGIAAYNSKEPEAAAEADLRAIDVDPKSAVAYNNLGNIYRDQTKYDLAVAAYNKGIELDPKYEFAYTNLQALLNGLHRPLWAQRILLQAIAALPNSANLRAQMGDLMASQKRYKEARDNYEAALKIDPNHNQATQGLTNLPKQ